MVQRIDLALKRSGKTGGAGVARPTYTAVPAALSSRSGTANLVAAACGYSTLRGTGIDAVTSGSATRPRSLMVRLAVARPSSPHSN